MMRLQQFIAKCGVTSRRKAEELMLEGAVKVNGKTITEMGYKVDENNDSVKVNGKVVKLEGKVYILMNKPEGCVCAASDDQGRKTVIDLLPSNVRERARLFPVGRLDYNTTGCLFITNDGEWANRVTHPKFKVEKVYVAKIKGRLTPLGIERLKKGVTMEGKRMKAESVSMMSGNESNDAVRLVITQGVNHQVKLMMTAVGAGVVRLRREKVGPVSVRGLEPGMWRDMAPSEINYFMGKGEKLERKKRP
jgi:23S rRNA pseudouridine2605 synthase